ncbi:MAG: 4-hydroxy-tetrahydrodipicolinate reductase [Candidatus Cloacimonadaceae bacterium]
MLSICLIGYGKMGKMIEQLCPQKGVKIAGIIDPTIPNAAKEINPNSLADADVAIDFSHPSAVIANIERLIELKQNCVIGTTGWDSELPRLKSLAEKAGIGMVYGANFSLGLNLFSRILSEAVKIVDYFEEYDILGWEKHHAQKADSPSGTAIELAKIVLAGSSRKSKVVWDKLERKPEADELHFASIRGGQIPGTHALAFDSPADTIELTHTVRNRSTFAMGALSAAQWINGKQGIYSFSEVIGEILC